jgi:hypothetical protein
MTGNDHVGLETTSEQIENDIQADKTEDASKLGTKRIKR